MPGGSAGRWRPTPPPQTHTPQVRRRRQAAEGDGDIPADPKTPPRPTAVSKAKEMKQPRRRGPAINSIAKTLPAGATGEGPGLLELVQGRAGPACPVAAGRAPRNVLGRSMP